MSLIEMALAFVTSHPAVTAAIIGPRTMEQLESQLPALEDALRRARPDRRDRPARDERQPERHRLGPALARRQRLQRGCCSAGSRSRASSPASSRPGASTSATTSARSPSTSPARSAARGIFCIVDLHAITVAYDPAELRERLYDTTAILLAAGLDPARCILFRQSDVPEHTELTWLLSSVTELGRLQRMHQFRDKSLAQRELVSAGLLLYPVLQAADVLAYRAARGARRRGPARAPRADARRRAALQRALRRRRGGAGRARAPDPRGRRADHGPAGPDERRCRRPAAPSRAPCTCSTSPRRSRRSSRAPSPTPAARCAAPRRSRASAT